MWFQGVMPRVFDARRSTSGSGLAAWGKDRDGEVPALWRVLAGTSPSHTHWHRSMG
jgi:hypothetical protein